MDAPELGNPTQTDPLAAAITAGDAARARTLLDAPNRRTTPDEIRAVASIHLRQRHWSQAAQLLSRIAAADAMAKLQFNLARNFAAMQIHRPALYEVMMHLPAQSGCQIVAVKDGLLSIAQTLPGKRPTVLSPQGDPLGTVAQAMEQLKIPMYQGDSVALCGIGDGYLLQQLAAKNWGPGSPMGQQPPIYILEPDPLVLFHVLMIHDLSQTDGALQQQRCQWFIGANWHEQLRQVILHDDLDLPLAPAVMELSLLGIEMAAKLHEIWDELRELQTQFGKHVTDYYANFSAEKLAELFSPQPPRPPRVLILTSRFTTVLQHSSRDTADALEKIGCETKLLIEKSPHHALTVLSLQQALLSFKPDMVFTIDHLRRELVNIFPANLPFICWIQDHLPNLTNRDAGASIGLRDFILAHGSLVYQNEYNYPARQCIYMPKLTRVPHRPARIENDGDDIAFVSNAARLPEQIAQLIASSYGENFKARELIFATLAQLKNVYAQGSHVDTPQQLNDLLEIAEKNTQININTQTARETLSVRLFDELNNTMYRQQALRWVIAAAKKRNMRVALYGAGWEKNPEFGEYAKGALQYGPQLEEVTRRAKINLQIVPYLCTHQRLLDGLVAGGFFLIRLHTSDITIDCWRRIGPVLMERGIMKYDDARKRLSPEEFALLNQAIDGHKRTLDYLPGRDPLYYFEKSTREGVDYESCSPPNMFDVGFTDAASFETKLDHFIEYPDLRRQISDRQRQYVEKFFTYEAGMKRMCMVIRNLLLSESAEGGSPESPEIQGKISESLSLPRGERSCA